LYQGEHVYCTPGRNALASTILIDQITPHLPKENEEVNAHVKHLQAMHAAGLKTSAEIGSVSSRSSAMRVTLTIMAPTTTNLTNNILQKGDTF
jgi:hypothetical protein